MSTALTIIGCLWVLPFWSLAVFYGAAAIRVYRSLRWIAFVLGFDGFACFMIGYIILAHSILFAGVTGIVTGIALILTATIPCAYEKFDHQPFKLWRNVALSAVGICFVGLGTAPFWPVLS